MHKIMTDKFSLEIQPFVEKEKICYDTSLMVKLSSYSFSAEVLMEMNREDLANFAVGLKELDETLKGKVKIEHSYIDECYIEFEADKMGHIRIKGCLSDGCNQKIYFENEIDQTYLQPFAKSLHKACKDYLPQ